MRNTFIRFGFVLMTSLVLVGYSAAQTTTTLVTPSGAQPQTAGPGDAVLAFQATRPLPNIFGQPDIFGRTVSAGHTTVRYLGTQDGHAVFERLDVSVQSNATTMSEMPIIFPNTTRTTVQGTVGTTQIQGRATSTSSQVLPPRGSTQHATTAQPIRFSLGNGQSTVIEGRTLTVRQVNSNSVIYVVQ
jgi:hypothetical protein